MSIENNLESIAKSLAIVAAYCSKVLNAPVGVTSATEPASTPIAAPASTPIAAPVLVAPIATPTFMASSTAVPFNDHKGLIEYVMSVYKELGPVKGVEIQGILTKMKCTNINEVKPEQYADFFADCEKLKVA